MKIPAAALCRQPGQAGSAGGYPAKVGAGSECRIPALERRGRPSGSAFVCTTIKAHRVGLARPTGAAAICAGLCVCLLPALPAAEGQRRNHFGLQTPCLEPSRAPGCVRSPSAALPAARGSHVALPVPFAVPPTWHRRFRSAQPAVGFGVGPGGVTATSRFPECPCASTLSCVS